MPRIARTTLIALLTGVAFAQSTEITPQFEIADVHASAPSALANLRTRPIRNGRYEIRNATMLDLIRIAWNYPAEKIVGGPSWLELDRFDVTAKIPSGAAPDTEKSMLQALLKDRFGLALHRDMRPSPAWALTKGSRKLQLKEADGAGETGCKLPTSGPVPEGGTRVSFGGGNYASSVILGRGYNLRYSCRNMTMSAFAANLRSMQGVLVNTPVLDRTGLNGMWNFDVNWSMPVLNGEKFDRISVPDALEKQLGLKLEQVPVPADVLVVDHVNRTPSPNAPGIAEALPAATVATQFEVADVKLMGSDLRVPPNISMQPGGRFVSEGLSIRSVLVRALNTRYSDDIAGLPSWASTVQISITARAPAESNIGPNMEAELLAPMLRSLFEERFGLKWHTEQRALPAFALVAVKPKLKRPEPDSRTYCRVLPPTPEAPILRTLKCQNAPLSLLAEKLPNFVPGVNLPVYDATGLEGNWDFTLTADPTPYASLPTRDRSPESALDPIGSSTIFDSLEKQLGLKLETQKRTRQVIVIDHLDQKPTDN